MGGFNLNSVTVGGNLTRDPELRSVGDTVVCNLGLAVNGRKKDASGAWVDVPNYFTINVWGRMGEICAERLSKGMKFACTGRLQWRQWEAEGGAKRQAVDIVADSLMFPDEGGGGGRSSSQSRSDIPADDFDSPASDVPASGAEDDIPF